ncbi:MAG: phasin family protein [Anaerolinea sp.]|nr:phasin family protein [Anaerolinea sp.]
MAEKTIEVQEEMLEKELNTMLAAARKVLLAGIGVVALAQEEIEDFVNRLIERGEIAEKDGRKLISDIVERRKKQVEEVESELESKIEEMLNRMNVPTKADIDALSRKITTLTKKVDELKKAS